MIRAALLCLAMALLPAAGHAADPLTVRLDWTTHVIHLPYFLAQSRGWFAKAGLEPDIEDGNGSVTTVQLVGARNFDIGQADLAAMAVGRGKGVQVTSIAAYLRRGPIGIIYAQKLGVQKLQDLKGLKVAFTAGSMETPFLQPFFAANGLPPGSLEMISVTAPAKISTFVSGKVDAVVTTVPGDLPHMDDRPAAGFLFADYGFNLPGFGLVANPDTLAAKGDAIRRFVSVVCGAWGYILNGHAREAAEATKAARPAAPQTVSTLIRELDGYGPYFYSAATKEMPICMQSKADWDDTVKTMIAAGVLPAGSDPAGFFTNAYIDPAYAKSIIGE